MSPQSRAQRPGRGGRERLEPVRSDFLVFGRPLIERPAIDEVVDSLETGWIGTGPKVQRFERMLEEYVGAEHVRCVSSCTAALILTLKALGFGPGDEVLVPAMTFVASANAVEHVGACPVLVDSDPGTGLIDLDRAAEAVTPRTRGIMPVHMAGRPVDRARLDALAERHGLSVIEDAAHAIGAESGGRRIGGHGRPTSFSFYPTKNITTGEGGAVATNDSALADRVEQLALHGLSTGAWQRFADKGFRHYEAVEPGYKYNMTDLQAALGLHQLPQLDKWIDARADGWDRYDEWLADLPLATPEPPEAGTRHARHLYQVLVEDEAEILRDDLVSALHEQRIGVGIHYRGVHLHEYYRERYSLAPEQFPVATDISERTLSLPLGPGVTPADQEDVVLALRRGLGEGS